MTDAPTDANPDRLLLRYYLYRVTNTSGFFLPVAILILVDKDFGLGFVGLAYGVYAFAKLAVEIPTGYAGDWLGRRHALAVGNGVRAVVVGVYPFVPSETGYLALHVLWAVGRSFSSGTQNAWLYEILQAAFDPESFARIKSRGNVLKLSVDAAAAIAGGVLYGVARPIPFVATAAIAACGIPILLTFPSIPDLSARSATATPAADGDAAEPASDGDSADSAPLTPSTAVRLLRDELTRPAVRWLVVYAALFYSLFVVTRIYEQPVLDAVGVPVAGLGVVYAGFKLVSAVAASTVGRLERAIGIRGIVAAMVPAYALAYASILLAPVLVVPVLFVNRAIRTVTSPAIDQYLNQRIGDVGRATVLSGASMAFAIVGGTARIASGWVTTVLPAIEMLLWAGVGLSALAAVVWVACSPLRGVDSGADTTVARTGD